MTTITKTKLWDLAHVLDFNALSLKAAEEAVPSLQVGPETPISHPNPEPEELKTPSNYEYNQQTSLGDFSRIYQYLGTPRAAPVVTTLGHGYEAESIPTKIDYASDGGAYTSRHVTQAQSMQVSDTTDTEEPAVRPGTAEPTAPDTMTKGQRKKANRRARKAQESLLAAQKGTVSESEVEGTSKKTPAKKASVHVVHGDAENRYNLRPRDASGMLATPSKVQSFNAARLPAYSSTPSKPSSFNAARLPAHSSTPGQPDTIETPVKTQSTAREAVNAVCSAIKAKKQAAIAATTTPKNNAGSPLKKAANPVTPLKPANVAVTSTPKNNPGSPSKKAAIPVISSKQANVTVTPTPKNGAGSPTKKTANPVTPSKQPPPVQVEITQYVQTQNSSSKKAGKVAANLVPLSVQPPINQPSAQKAPSTAKQAAATATAPRVMQPIIEPKIIRSGDDRYWALLLKIIKDFPTDRQHLVAPMNLTNHNNHPNGIHVFVDASNIFIGFMDQLKRSRNIHAQAHVAQADLSFDALALLMERRRPVAKRVLAGSTPHLPAFDKAEEVGYECSILEKVFKVRELTERQVYFKELDKALRSGRKFVANKPPPPVNRVASAQDPSMPDPSAEIPSAAYLPGLNGGTGSGSETNAPQYSKAKMMEQGVDEILHLKILESVVDCDVPGTIVLATGDAAQAEYSNGFMAMAERALRKGWTIELVSWSKNISAMYTKAAWRTAWGNRFRIVYLDDYAEELLDM